MQFSFSRFWYLFKLQIAVNRKLYLLGMAAIAGIMLCYMFYSVYANREGLDFQTQMDGVTVGMLLIGAFFGSLIFNQYSDKDKRIQYMLLPVSHAERLAVAIVFTFILFPLAFILLYFICVLLANTVDVQTGKMNGIYMLDGIEGWYLFVAYCFYQSMVLLGAIWFRKFTFVKTVVMASIVTLCILFGNDMITKTLMPYTEKEGIAPEARLKNMAASGDDRVYWLGHAAPFRNMHLMRYSLKPGYENEGYRVSVPANQQIPFMCMLGLVPLFFFYITGVKLREQQL